MELEETVTDVIDFLIDFIGKYNLNFKEEMEKNNCKNIKTLTDEAAD